MKVYELRYAGSARSGGISVRGPTTDGDGFEEMSKWAPKYRDADGIRLQAENITLALDLVKDCINTQIEGANVIGVEDSWPSDNLESERKIFIEVKEGTRRAPGLNFRLVEISAQKGNKNGYLFTHTR